MGNEGEVHNYHLTYEIAAEFTFRAGTGQFFHFRGTGDTYLFVIDVLVMDLGGVGYNANKVQLVDMDRLGLVDGQTVQFKLFHAQRARGLAVFDLRTNIVLNESGPLPAITLGFD